MITQQLKKKEFVQINMIVLILSMWGAKAVYGIE